MLAYNFLDFAFRLYFMGKRLFECGPISGQGTANSRFIPEFKIQMQTTAGPLASSHIALDDSDPRFSRSIETLRLSYRAHTRLLAEGIHLIGELVVRREEELLAIPHLGPKSCREIKARLLEIGLRLGMQTPRVLAPQQITANPTPGSDTIEDLTLSIRTRKCLHRANILTISELQKMKDQELLSIRNFGKKCLLEIKTKLRKVQPETVGREQTVPSPKPESRVLDLHSEAVMRKLKINLSDLPLSVRSRGSLEQKNIRHVWQLARMSESELLRIRNLGRKSYNELKAQVEGLGLWFGIELTPEQISGICAFECSPETISLEESIKELVNELCGLPLEFLNEKENSVLAQRILKVGRKSSLEEIAQGLNLSRERIRQVEKSALNKIRQQFRREAREVVYALKQQANQVGGLANFDVFDIDLAGLTAQEQVALSCLVGLIDQELFFDWDYGLVSTRGERRILTICDEIQSSILSNTPGKFFSHDDLEEALRKVVSRHGLFVDQSYGNLIKKFLRAKKISSVENQLCFGRATKQDNVVLAFKKYFPDGLDVYKRHSEFKQRLLEFDEKMFANASPRSVLASLTNHPDVLLWGRGFFTHKDNVSYEEEVIKKVATWIEGRFEQGHSRFQVDIPFNAFKQELRESGVSNQYALYTLLRLQNRKRIGQRKFPTIVDLEAEVDIQEGILEEIEHYFLSAGGAVPCSQLREEFLVRRGWKIYSLQQNITVNSESIYPWQDNSYIHLEYMDVDYARLEELLEALRRKLRTIEGAYSLKGAKREMNVLWEQVCPAASVRTMVKLIRAVDPEYLQIEGYFIQFAEASAESVSTVAELEEFFLEKGQELSKFDLQEEFRDRRGWTENQLYAAIRKARLFRSGKSTFLHPTTINWNEGVSQQVHQVLESHLEKRNNNQYPQVQLQELIDEYVLPELPHDIQWTGQLLKSVGQEFGDFLFFDDAYILVDNEFGIEDLDDMIGFLIARNFKLGIAKRGEVESMLWREGILEGGRPIPEDQFFAESSIMHLPASDEVGLSKTGFKRYGRPI